MSTRALAKLYGCHPKTIQNIINGKTKPKYQAKVVTNQPESKCE